MLPEIVGWEYVLVSNENESREFVGYLNTGLKAGQGKDNGSTCKNKNWQLITIGWELYGDLTLEG